MPNKISKLQIDFISLVKAGANGRQLIAKSGDQPEKMLVPIAKTDTERRVAYCVVYAPQDPDAHEDFADAQDILKAAYGFMARGRNAMGTGVDREHDWQPTENFVAESWIVEKELGKGFINAEGQEEPDGSWVVGIKVVDDQDWKNIQKGKVNGISMAGSGEREKDVELAKGRLKEMVEGRKWRDLGWSFAETVDAILRDDDVTDKKAAIQDAVKELTALTKADQKEKPMSIKKRVLKAFGFKGGEDVLADFNTEAEQILKSESPTEAALTDEHEAASKVLAEMDDAAEFQPKLDDALAKAKERLPKASHEPDQANIVKSAIEEGLKPINDQLTKLSGRIENLEKATPPTSRQDTNGVDGDDDAVIQI